MASTRGGVAPGPGRAPPVAPTRTPPPRGPNAYSGEYGPELGRVIALTVVAKDRREPEDTITVLASHGVLRIRGDLLHAQARS